VCASAIPSSRSEAHSPEGRFDLRAWSCHAEPVAVQVLQVALSPCKAFLVHGNPEFGRNRVDVLEVQMDEGVRSSIALVLGEVEADASTRDGDEQREAGLELMLPLLAEAQALVPGDGTSRVLDVQDRDDLFFQDAQRIASARRLRGLTLLRAKLAAQPA
jgi:hypothetical protein